jgi:hypothetical protein
MTGVEPACLTAPDPKSGTSANFATSAQERKNRGFVIIRRRKKHVRSAQKVKKHKNGLERHLRNMPVIGPQYPTFGTVTDLFLLCSLFSRY